MLLGVVVGQEGHSLNPKAVVQASIVKARSQASFFGPVAFELKHKQEVKILENKGAFVLVEWNGAKGWIPKSAVATPEKLELRKGRGVSLSNSNAMTAGKGLKVSDGASSSGQSVPEAVVDQVETMTPEREGELESFIQEGGLKRGSIGAAEKRK